MTEPLNMLTIVEIIDAGDLRSQAVIASDGAMYPCGVLGITVGDEGVIIAGHFCTTGPSPTELLGIAASSAVPSDAPTPDPQVIEAFTNTPAQDAAEVARLHDEGKSAEYRLVPLYSLEDARNLPEVPALDDLTGYEPYTALDEREIVSFKDADGRTMLVLLTPDVSRLVKVCVRDGSA